MRSASMGPNYRDLADASRGKALVDLVLEEAGRRGRGHELPVNFGRHAAELQDLTVAELDLQQLRLGVVADAPDLARIDALALHGYSRDTVMVSPPRTEAKSRASPSMRPSTLQGLTSFGSLPSDIGVRPQGRASELPSTQKQTVPGGTTCLAVRSRVAFTAISK